MKKYFALFITMIVFSSVLALAASPQPKVREHVLDVSAQQQQVTAPEFSSILGVTLKDGKVILLTREPQGGDGTTRTFNLVVLKSDEELPAPTVDVPTYVGTVCVSGTLYHIFSQLQ